MVDNDINGDEAMKNLDDLTDKLFRKKEEEEIKEDEEVDDD